MKKCEICPAQIAVDEELCDDCTIMILLLAYEDEQNARPS